MVDQNDIHVRQRLKLGIVEDDVETGLRFSRIVNENSHNSLVFNVCTLAEARSAIRAGMIDIVLLDLDLPDGNGIDLIREWGALSTGPMFIVITVFEDNDHLLRAIEYGAMGYVVKDDTSMDVSRAIEIVRTGGAPISPGIARKLLSRLQAGEFKVGDEAQPGENVENSLTPRETDVLKLVSLGYSDQEIADAESISYHTVTTHVKNVYKKLQVRSRVEATRKALSHGLVDI